MGWNQIQSIIDQNDETEKLDAQEPPVTCPLDGAILDIGSDGHTRNCPMGNYRWE